MKPFMTIARSRAVPGLCFLVGCPGNAMRSLTRAFALGMSMLVLAACASGGSVTAADYDRSADFSAYRTFAFFEPIGTDTADYTSLVTQALTSAVRREMESRGYTYVEADPDLLINFNTRLTRRTHFRHVPPMPMYYGYNGGLYMDPYTEGALNIHVVDARRKQLVWEGIAVGSVTEGQLQARQDAINLAVTEIFTRYPSRAGE